MPTEFFEGTKTATRGAAAVVKDGFKVATRNPQIVASIYSGFLFISLTYPLVGASLFAHWYNRIFAQAGDLAPHRARIILGLVGFSVFYAALVTAYFSCAISASVLAKLEGRSTPPLYGWRQVSRHFLRITRFAFAAVFFFPMAVYAQRRKLPKGVVGVVGNSLTLHMAQVAPEILTEHKGVGATIRGAIKTFSRTWREGLVLKVWMYIGIFLVIALPKLIQHYIFHSRTAANVGWLVSLELATSGLVIFKLINTVFTTVLYHQSRQRVD